MYRVTVEKKLGPGARYQWKVAKPIQKPFRDVLSGAFYGGRNSYEYDGKRWQVVLKGYCYTYERAQKKGIKKAQMLVERQNRSKTKKEPEGIIIF